MPLRYMDMALEAAAKAGQSGEVPVGAVLVSQSGQILAKAYNQTITSVDPSAHAEILALREGSLKINNYRILSATLYVTIEPCPMCMGAILHARLGRLVFGAADPKWGAAGSLYDFSQDRRLNHRIEIVAGVREKEARKLMQDFFRRKRQ